MKKKRIDQNPHLAKDLTYDECLFYYGDLLGKRKWEEQQKRKNDDTR